MRNDKKNLYILIMIITSFFITIGYAVLNLTLNINGRTNISKNIWDVYFDNIKVKVGSVDAVEIPTVSDKTAVDFEVQLNLPGDYYEFTVDVVNNGTIDAMIESIEKLPELTEEQEKYLNYIITYENDDVITTKQLVSKESFVRLKVRVEIKKDIDATDLPEVGDVLYLSFAVNYQQADNNGVSVKDDGIKKVINVVSGDGLTTGDEVCVDTQCFNVISSDENEVKLFAKYNLHIGNYCASDYNCLPLENPTGIQDPTARGFFSGYSSTNPAIGVLRYSGSVYWDESTVSSSPYVYNENSYLYEHVENYKKYLEDELGLIVNEARLISLEEMRTFGCSSEECPYSVKNMYNTSFWLGTASYVYPDMRCFYNNTGLIIYKGCHIDKTILGIRPVIVIPRDYFE